MKRISTLFLSGVIVWQLSMTAEEVTAVPHVTIKKQQLALDFSAQVEVCLHLLFNTISHPEMTACGLCGVTYAGNIWLMTSKKRRPEQKSQWRLSFLLYANCGVVPCWLIQFGTEFRIFPHQVSSWCLLTCDNKAKVTFSAAMCACLLLPPLQADGAICSLGTRIKRLSSEAGWLLQACFI